MAGRKLKPKRAAHGQVMRALKLNAKEAEHACAEGCPGPAYDGQGAGLQRQVHCTG